MENFEALKSENRSLRILAEQDSLTGLLNRRTMEEKINQMVKNNITGVFIMLDLDGFKLINDKYGHLMGDRILQELGRLISYLFFKRDAIGRIGGDEFAVFVVGEYKETFIMDKIESLRSRIRQAGDELGLKRSLDFTAGAALTEKGITFEQLYERADCAMRSGKLEGKNKLCFYESSIEQRTRESTPPGGPNFYVSDMKYIIQELKETEPPNGTYFQEYPVFLTIYRLFERLLGRFGLKCHLMLLTLMDASGNYVNLEELEPLMDKLCKSICLSLRISDIYTRYSNCQFLVMTPGAERKDMEVIIKRIQDVFQEKISGRQDITLAFTFYPMKPGIPVNVSIDKNVGSKQKNTHDNHGDGT